MVEAVGGLVEADVRLESATDKTGLASCVLLAKWVEMGRIIAQFWFFFLDGCPMYCVEISARIIHWPRACACRRPNTTLEISSTRVTGKRVIHTHTKSWEAPYCRKCLAHINAFMELRRFSMFVLHLSLVFGLVGAALVLLLFFTLIQLSAPLAVCLSLLAAAATTGIVLATFR